MAISDTNYNYNSQNHPLGRNVKSNSIFKAPLLFVGLDRTGLLDSDSARSPTSPLDVTWLSNLGNPFRTPRSLSNEGQQKRWDCSKVGLSIIDSLEDCCKFSGNILLSSESKKPSLSPQMVIKTPNCKTKLDSVEASKSLPKDFCKLPYTRKGSIFHKGESNVHFEIGDTLLENEALGKTSSCSLDLDSLSPIKDQSSLTGSNSDNFVFNQVSSPPHFIGGSQNSNTLLPTESNTKPVSLCSSNDLVKSLSPSEIEHSEDYTCVISHGANPKTTHIFCDCILESHCNDFKNQDKKEENMEGVPSLVVNRSETPNQYPYSNFLSLCYHCNKKLEEGKDIYIYRGEKAFCSLECRAIEIMTDEELEKSNPASENSSKWEFDEELFEAGNLKAP